MGDNDEHLESVKRLREAWYFSPGEVLQGTLVQGVPEAFLRSVEPLEAGVIHHSIGIVLTQSCDIRKTSRLLLARVAPYQKIYELGGYFAGSEFAEALVDGMAVGHFLLPPRLYETDSSWLVVSFRETFHVNREFCEEWVSQKAHQIDALRPPYREYLSQAYARFVMRVGMPPESDSLGSLFKNHRKELKAKPKPGGAPG